MTELQDVALSVGLQKFAGKQLAEWLYVKRVTSFDQMTNISLKGREVLQAKYTIGRHAPIREAVSIDGTKKYLFEVGGHKKTFDQIKDIPDSFLAVDDIETGRRNRIPLYMFGFLY